LGRVGEEPGEMEMFRHDLKFFFTFLLVVKIQAIKIIATSIQRSYNSRFAIPILSVSWNNDYLPSNTTMNSFSSLDDQGYGTKGEAIIGESKVA